MCHTHIGLYRVLFSEKNDYSEQQNIVCDFARVQ